MKTTVTVLPFVGRTIGLILIVWAYCSGLAMPRR
jgi:hypothetical protein